MTKKHFKALAEAIAGVEDTATNGADVFGTVICNECKKKPLREIKFVCDTVRWFDKVNGNTYHSVKVTRCADTKVLHGEFQYGYGEQYKQTALTLIFHAGWLPKKYDSAEYYLYERENNYPVLWNVCDGLKRECIANGEE